MFFYERIKIRRLILVNILLSILIFAGIIIYERSVYLRVDKNFINLLIYLGILLWFFWRAYKSGNTISDLSKNYKKAFNWKEVTLVICYTSLYIV